MANYTGASGDDHEVGTSGNDTFHMESGGIDTVEGGAGQDLIYFGASLTAADHIDGGIDGVQDSLFLDGDYSAGLVFEASTMHNIDKLVLAGGHSYRLALNNGNIAAGHTLDIEAGLSAGESLRLDAHRETDGAIAVTGGAGDDTLFGGAGNDFFNLGSGGDDVAKGGGGDDSFLFFGGFTAADRVDGGAGYNTLLIGGGLPAGVKLSAKTFVHISEVDLGTGDYTLKTVDANVGPGEQLRLLANNLGVTDNLIFDGSKETDGSFLIVSGEGVDTIKGGAGDDIIHGGWGADVLTGGAGADIFVYDNFLAIHVGTDRITDLTDADIISLTGIDADDHTEGDQAFTLVDNFTHHAGELILHYDSASKTTTLSVDTNGDAAADGQVQIDGNHAGFTHFYL